MVGLMISTIELIVWLAIALFALMVRVGLGLLSLVLTAAGWIIGRKGNPRTPGEKQDAFGYRYGAAIGIGLILILGAAIYAYRTGSIPFHISGL